MKLFPRGEHVFHVLSRYDDLLAIEGRPDYEPGDTLALIAPFLAHHGISETHMTDLAVRASLTPGASRLVGELLHLGWSIFCITTTYEQYAAHLTARLGIPRENVACTTFPPGLTAAIGEDDHAAIHDIERAILDLKPGSDDDRIRSLLDRFFWQDLPGTRAGRMLTRIKPVGGERKATALRRFARRHRQPLKEWAAVGDSITDCRMLAAVNRANGLAVAFNANEYPLPHATMGLAAPTIYPLEDVLHIWSKNGIEALETAIRQREGETGNGRRPAYYQWLHGSKDTSAALQSHRTMRYRVRRAAATLG